jgi:excisionase family DNA binding protein
MASNTTNESDLTRPTTEAVLTVSDAARFLKVSESIVRRLIRERRIPFFRIDGRYLLFRPLLEKWIVDISIEPETHSPGIPGIDKEGKIWS